MITNFFTSNNKRSNQNNEIQTNPIGPTKAKKAKKRSSLTGFSKDETPNRIKNMEKYKPAGDWRKTTQIKINYTYITKKWIYNDLQCEEEYIIPFGMLKTMERLFSHKKCYQSFNVLPEFVKNELNISSENYDKNNMNLIISHKGNRGMKSFYYIYCHVCHKDKFPALLKKYKDKLPNNPKTSDVLEAWDNLNLSPDLLDLAGCIIPDEPKIHAAPNGRRFILRPTEHSANHVKPSSNPGSDAVTNVRTNKLVSNQKGNLSSETAVTSISKSGETSITVKYNAKLKLMHVGQMLDPQISLFSECKDDLDVWAKKFCLKTVHTGVNKLVSNNSSIEFYDSVMDGVREYHSTVLSGVEINNCRVAPPPKVKLNKNNISQVQSAILESYKQSSVEGNPYVELNKHYGKYYSIMHDGIQKYSRELNGSMVRTVSSSYDNSRVVNVPWGLTEIDGGSLNAVKLVKHLITLIHSIKPVSNNAYSEVLKQLEPLNNGIPLPLPPDYFKCCKLSKLEQDRIYLEMKHWPTSIMADGCATNNAANNKISDLLGILSPSLRCVVHAADGSIKRMTNSKTMNLQAVSDFLPALRSVLRHFQLSGKSTALLNEALDVLEMKSVHMMSFCPTRMSYILTACAQTVVNLVPLCDVISTANLKPEESSSFMSPKGMIILHLLADLESLFLKYYLKVLDTDDSLIISIYDTSLRFVKKMENEFHATNLENFLNCLVEDDNGNIIAEVLVPSNQTKHTVTLNYTHRPSRNQRISKIELIKTQGQALKESLCKNIIENIKDQNQSGTLIEYASAFDMNITIGIEVFPF